MDDQELRARHRAERKRFEDLCRALGLDAKAIVETGRWKADEDNEDRAYARAAGFSMHDHKIVTGMRDFTSKISRDSFVFLAGRVYHVDSLGPKRTVLSQVMRVRPCDKNHFSCDYRDGRGGEFHFLTPSRRSTDEFLADLPVLVSSDCVSECLRAIEGYAWGLQLAGREYGYMEVMHQLGRLLLVLEIIGVRRFEDSKWRIS